METNQAGKPSSDAPLVPPWERVWNEIKDTVAPTDTTPTEAKPAKLWPWERFWGGSGAPKPAAPPRPPVAPMEGNRAPNPTALEKDMAKAVVFTPREEAARNADMKSPAFLKGLTDELAKAKNPTVIATLKEEIAKFNKRK
jgi:hypothetical protein